jgi:hypothetical protein
MKIMSKGRYPAATREMIADERHTRKHFHFVVSRALVEAGFARVGEGGT